MRQKKRELTPAERKRRRIRIRIEMLKRDIVGAQVARELGVTTQMVNQVVAGAPGIWRNRRVIAALVERGVPARMFEEGG